MILIHIKILQLIYICFIHVLTTQHPYLNNINFYLKKLYDFYCQIVTQKVCEILITTLKTNCSLANEDDSN